MEIKKNNYYLITKGELKGKVIKVLHVSGGTVVIKGHLATEETLALVAAATVSAVMIIGTVLAARAGGEAVKVAERVMQMENESGIKDIFRFNSVLNKYEFNYLTLAWVKRNCVKATPMSKVVYGD